jgi:hypothetical protein
MKRVALWLALLLAVSLTLAACGDEATPTPVAVPDLATLGGFRAVTPTPEVLNQIQKSLPSGTVVTRLHTFALPEEPASFAPTLDKALSNAGFTPIGKPVEKDGAFTRFYKSSGGAEVVASYGATETHLANLKTLKVSDAALATYRESLGNAKTVLGITGGTGFLRLYGV